MQLSMGTLNSICVTLLKVCQRFDAISTSNLEVYQFRDRWILTFFIIVLGESSPNNIWTTVNLERTFVLLFYYFLCLKVNLDLEKTNQLGESSPNFIFSTVVNLDRIIFEKGWIDGESWPNDFVEKVNRVEDLRWVGSRCPLTHALTSRSVMVDMFTYGYKIFSCCFRKHAQTHTFYSGMDR